MDYFESHPFNGEEAKLLINYQSKLSQLKADRTVGNMILDPQLEEFFQMWDVTGFTAPFDYTDWAEKNGIDLDNADEIIKFFASAEKEDVRRLSTAVVRMEKYSEGYLNALWEKGFLQILFKKLKEYI